MTNLNPDGSVRDDDGPDDLWAARHLAAMAVVNCELCDEYGYCGSRVCDHVDHEPAAKRGMARVYGLMGWRK